MNYLIYTGIAIAVYLIFRELNCWYLKTNQILEAQQETNRLLQKIINSKEVKPTVDSASLENFEQTSINDPKVLEALVDAFDKNKSST